MTYLAHRYYTGKLRQGELPPDICLEIALWDRFGWGPEQTDRISLIKLREVFTVLEQQKASRDAVDNLGKPNEARLREKAAAKMMESKRVNAVGPGEEKATEGT